MEANGQLHSPTALPLQKKLTVSIGCVRPEVISDTVEERKISRFFRESKSNPSALKATAQSLYWLTCFS
jgi:hypothetical protein